MINATDERLELMTTILGSKAKAEEAISFLASCVTLPDPETVMRKVKSIGTLAAARKVVAAARLSSCYLLNIHPVYLGNPDLIAWYTSALREKDAENFVVVTLATDNTLIDSHVCSVGDLHRTIVDPAAVFRHAITDNANAVVLVHNHPSGDLDVSSLDQDFTCRLVAGGRLLGIRVLDSIIVTKRGYRSIRAAYPALFEH